MPLGAYIRDTERRREAWTESESRSGYRLRALHRAIASSAARQQAVEVGSEPMHWQLRPSQTRERGI